MATIDQRPGPDGKPVYRVRVRRKGTPTQTATFPNLSAARRWAQMTEGQIIEGRHFPCTKPTRHTLAEALDRYVKEVLPHKGTHIRYNQRYLLRWWHKHLGAYTLSNLTPALIAQCRDTLATTRAPATVRAYLCALSHVLTVASSEWNWLDHSPMPKVRKLKLPRGRVRFLSRSSIAYRPLDTRHDLWPMSSGDRSTATNLEGIIWTRTTAKDAKCNAWPRPHSPYSLWRTTLALAEGTPKSHMRKPRQATAVIT